MALQMPLFALGEEQGDTANEADTTQQQTTDQQTTDTTEQESSVSCHIEDGNFIVELPQGWQVLMQNGQEDQEALAALGITEYAFAEGAQLYAVHSDPLAEMNVTVYQDDNSKDIYDYTRLTSKEMDQVISELNEQLEKEGQYVLGETATYTAKEAQWVVCRTAQDTEDGKVYGVVYYTIAQGRHIVLALQSYNGAMPQVLTSGLKQVADSLHFNDPAKAPVYTRVIWMGLVAGGVFIAGVLILVLFYSHRRRAEQLAQEQDTAPKVQNQPLAQQTENTSTDTFVGEDYTPKH